MKRNGGNLGSGFLAWTEYFHIGEKKMRQIVDENMDVKFLLENGNRVMIKRKLFEEYLDKANVI